MDYSLSARLPFPDFGGFCGANLSQERVRRISRARPAFDRSNVPGLRDWGMGVAVASPAGAGLILGATSAALSIANQIDNMIQTWGHNGYNNEASQVVNDAARNMVANLAAWNASPKCAADQMVALANYDKLWNGVVSTCTQIAGGPSSDSAAAGTRCIQDRLPGSKWPWQTYYRDPIANDPAAVQSWDPLTGEILANLLPNSCSSQPATSSASTGGAVDGSTPVSSTTGTGTPAGGSTSDLWSQLSSLNVAGIPVWLIAGGLILWMVIE